MDLKKLREIIKIVAESDVAEVEIDEDGAKVTVRKDAPSVTIQPAGYYPPPAYYPPPGAPQAPIHQAAAPASEPADQAAATPVSSDDTMVRAPIVGTYYDSPSPDSDPYVRVGSTVSTGDVLCIIEAMKLMNEIENEVTGTIKQILVQSGEPVEYDQPLFLIETA
jgi:acetyl-CoA carboxylase biotin carboxyl carrier protein